MFSLTFPFAQTPSTVVAPGAGSAGALIVDILPLSGAVGDTFTAYVSGSTGSPPGTIAYQWKLDGVNIGGATSQTYVSTTTGTLTVVATVTVVVSDTSDNVAIIAAAGAAPTIRSNPQISGDPSVGATLTMDDDGNWDGNPIPTLARNWQKDSVDIGGATGATYVVQAGDAGHDIRLRVTATNTAGSLAGYSGVLTIAGSTAAPVNTDVPTITGTLQIGGTLVGDDGLWTGSPAPTLARNWQRDGVDIASATDSSYVLVAADEGLDIRLRVTGTNSQGSATAYSTAVKTTPASIVSVQRSGDAGITGNFSNAYSNVAVGDLIVYFGFQRTSATVPDLPAGHTNIDTASANTMSLRLSYKIATGADVGTFWPCTGAGGSGSSFMMVIRDFNPLDPIGGVSGITSENDTQPTYAALDAEGMGLVVGFRGLKTPSLPLSSRSGMQVLASSTSSSVSAAVSAAGAAIGFGAVRSGPYTTVPTGDLIASSESSLGVTSAGTFTALIEINAAQVLSLFAPVNSVLPVISGTPTEGETLTADSDGQFAGNPTPTTARHWQRDGVDIGTETATTYVLVTADVGHNVGLRVTATNSQGSITASSNTVSVASATVAPANTVIPAFTGTPTVGQTLTKSTDGTWTGTPTPTLARNWQRDGVDIGGATATTYVLVTADGNHNVSLRVTGTNTAGASTASSNAVAIAPLIINPVNTVLPTITGTPTEGQTLTAASDGTWTGTPTPDLTRQWMRDDVAIPGETGTTYVLVFADANHEISVLVTGTNTGGSATAESNSVTIAATTTPPVNTVLPTFTGTPTEGQVLTRQTGTWTGTATITFATRWRLNGVDKTGSGVSSSTYTLLPGDVGGQISVKVTGTNAAGSSVAVSNSAPVASASAVPVNTVIPTISGTPTQGQTLTVSSDGTWTGTPTPTYTYHWQRDGTNISSATASTYVLAAADVGHQVGVLVTGTNTAGASNAASDTVAVAASTVIPTNTVAPTISGTPTVGQTLTATSDGTWTGTPSPTLTRKWQRDTTDIPGATGTTYVLVTADAGHNIRVLVTGTNTAGTVTAASSSLSVSQPATAPVNTGAPTISGAGTVGQTLTRVSDGTWTGSPTPTLARNWQRGGTDISGAINTTYVIQAADSGADIRLRVTGTNTAGAATAFSTAVSVTAQTAPVNTVAPVITGTGAVGNTLSNTTAGTWTGNPTPVLTGNWQRNGVDIPGEVGGQYVLVTADAGTNVRRRITGTNSVGASTAFSNAIAVTALAIPVNTVAPTRSGGAGSNLIGATITATSDGTWTGNPTPTLARNWQRDGDDIASETGTTYTLVGADGGHNIRFRVTGTNSVGADTGFCADLAVTAGDGPVNTVAPTISGTGTIGNTLTMSSAGTWTGTPAPTLARNWQRNGVDIGGATATTYVLVAADGGNNIRLRVTGTNTSGVVSGFSTAVAVTAANAPVNTVAPVITGTGTIGNTLINTTAGTWTGTPTPVLIGNWQRNGVDISGETGGQYVLVAADSGANIRRRITGTNSAGSATAYSNVIAVTGAVAPENTAVPTISGSSSQGSTLTLDDGTWTGNPTPTFARQWQRDGVNISSATGTTYQSVAADVNNVVRARVIGTNSAGSATAFSAGLTILSNSNPFNEVTVTTSNVIAALSAARTRPTRYLFSPGTYSEFHFPKSVTDFDIELVPLNRNNPPVLRGLNFSSGEGNGNWAAFTSQPAGTQYSRHIKIDGLNFITQRFNSGPGGISYILPVRAGDESDTQGRGLGWRVQGTTHPAANMVGGKESGRMVLLILGNTSGGGDFEVTNCMFDGGAYQIWWGGTGGGSLDHHHNRHQNVIEDGMKFNTGNWTARDNEFWSTRSPTIAMANATGGPPEPHGDCFQSMAGGWSKVRILRNVMIANNQSSNDGFNGGQIKAPGGLGDDRPVTDLRVEDNEWRSPHTTVFLLNDFTRGATGGADGTGYDVIIRGNKASTGGLSPYTGSPILGVTSGLNWGTARVLATNNVAPNCNLGGQSGNTNSNSFPGTLPSGWVKRYRLDVPNGANFSGRYGATGGVVTG